MNSNDLKQVFTQIYGIAGESEPDRLADEEILNIYTQVARKMSEEESDKKLAMEADLAGVEDSEKVLDWLLSNFDPQKVQQVVAEETQIIMGRWFSSVLPDLEHDKVLMMRDVLVELGKKVDGVSNQNAIL